MIDGKIQSDRISADQAYRKSHGLPQRPVDQAFIDALDFGLPACAGVAMGLERLQMLYDKSSNINDVITFAFEDSDD
jgi:lysyl-tRNA synthetase class 2